MFDRNSFCANTLMSVGAFSIITICKIVLSPLQ